MLYTDKLAHKTLFTALLQAKSRYGKKTIALMDADDTEMSYGDLIRASFAIGSVLTRHSKRGEKVGIMLPTGIGSLIAFFALLAMGRVPAMMNFTAGSRNLILACKAAEIKTIVSAHRFIKLADLGDLVSQIDQAANFLYLEDLRAEMNLKDKLYAVLGPIFPWAFKAHSKWSEPGVILFTSGTEGDPKGVVLSHANVVGNVEQIRCHIELHTDDIVFNPLPTFHCFGLTGGALLPLFSGMKVALYPSPLHTKTIPERIKQTKATILFATDTFISRYARSSKDGDLNTLRFAVCGAERVRDETRAMIRKTCDFPLLEGYGATEASPVIAVNQPEDNRHGTVGKLLPGMQHRLDPVQGIDKGGRLFVRGVNVMCGYLRSEAPGVLEATKDGWHDTGDIVEISRKGYVTIKGRAKRFAKIAGEMVSLAVVENCAKAVWPEHEHVATTRPDKRKGETIILTSDCPDTNRAELLAWAQSHGVPELSVPRKINIVESIPVLGTGKVDYVEVERELEKQGY
ncbi:Acyl-[acyl-carrier-protein] synthetase [hydrothermal vent metagenome]|uniref:Acyl-[acyl-carrier-protein] synthetase n=1 Tax=hydrothermal vent metagenome TaxID=652676 RepID=A0A3B0SDJ5_9ZZZZ